jgi:hypothetical protein
MIEQDCDSTLANLPLLSSLPFGINMPKKAKSDTTRPGGGSTTRCPQTRQTPVYPPPHHDVPRTPQQPYQHQQ